MMSHKRPSESAPQLRRLLGEPLLHFLLAGLFLFFAHGLLNANAEPDGGSRRIELTEGDLRQLTLGWLAQGRPAPTSAQLRSLVESRVREEILYREALALGLDRDDTIVRRRLAQKMEFLSEDVSAVHEPGGEALRAWFDAHSERFALPARASFRHLYFSPDRRGPRARDDAVLALRGLTAPPSGSQPAVAPGDAFMFQDHYGDRPVEELAALFGTSFAEELLRLPVGSWQGPVRSGYGWHLVWLESTTAARVPSFETVEPEVREAWVEEQRSAARKRAFEALRARYEVVLPAMEEGVPLETASR